MPRHQRPRDETNQRQTRRQDIKHQPRDDFAEKNLRAGDGAMNQKCPEVAVPFVVNLEPAENGAKDGAEKTDQNIR